jgi:hypothetical protein
MQDQAFADATRPTPRVILGVSLLDYSIGHELILQRERNPLLYCQPGDFKDLRALREAIGHALEVCSRTWEQNHRKIKIRFGIWWRLNIVDPTAVALLFSQYRFSGSSFPEMWTGDDERGRPLGSPFLARVLDYAASRFGLAAYDRPLGEIQWLYLAHSEAEGCCLVANEEEGQVNAEFAQHQADYAREQEAMKCQP